MKTRMHLITIISIGVILLSSCDLLAGQEPTITPDPASSSEQASTPDLSSMSLHERTIWDFEQFMNEMKELSSTAAATQPGDLDPINRQMSLIAAKIKNYDFPLEAALAHSVLYNYAFMTSQCYIIKFDVFINEMPEDEQDFFFGDFDRCERALVYEETFSMYLEELKETFASISVDTTHSAISTQTSLVSPPVPTSTLPPTAIPEHVKSQTLDEYMALVEPVLSEWNDSIEKVNDVLYQSVIEDLPRLRNEFASIECNPNFNIVRSRRIHHMDCQIASYLALIGPEGIEAMDLGPDPASYYENCFYNFDY
jgi:hypothetical protein